MESLSLVISVTLGTGVTGLLYAFWQARQERRS